MNNKPLLLTLFVFCLAVSSVFAQSRSGKVTDANGDPLIGATVLVKGTDRGTVTDANGEFSLKNVPDNAVIIISYTGYSSVEVAANGDLNVTMEEGTELGEVLVTAENRTVSAQRVPISIDLVGGEVVRENGILSLSQLQNLAPSLAFNQNTLFSQVFIRGVGSDVGASELQDQAATVSIDGEYINRPVALNASLFDLERVEVLKGPQGTLYGRNATAGAINIIAAKPKLMTTEAEATVQYGNYNSLKLNGALNLPLGKIAAVRLSAMSDKHDGYRDGGELVGDIDNGNVWGARLGLLVKPSDNFSVYVATEYNKTDQQAIAQYGVAVAMADTTLIGKTPANFQTELPEDFDVATAGFLKNDQLAFRGEIGYDFGGAKLTYRGGYRQIDLTNYQPLNGFVPETFSFQNGLVYNTQSHELRLNGESEKLIWQTGLFYGDESQDVGRGLILPIAAGAFGGQVPYLNWFDVKVNSSTLGIFGQATYNLSETLGLTGGLRYTSDNKSSDGFNIQAGPFGPPGTPAYFYPTPPTEGAPGTGKIPGAGEGTWSQLTWLANLEYKPNSNSLYYAKASTGYRSGGFTIVGKYEAEQLLAFEIGTKNTLANKRLRLNASAFVYNYQDQQVPVYISPEVGAQIQNAGKSNYFGIEIDGNYLVSPNDRFNVTINYLNAEYKELTTEVNVVGGDNVEVDLAGNTPAQSPKLTLIGGYHHIFPIGKGGLDVGLNSMFKSEYFLQPFNFDMDLQKSYTKTDFTITYVAGSGNWRVGAFVNNIEDNRILVYSSFVGGGIDIYNWSFGTPRTIGARFSYNFSRKKQ